MKPELLQHVRDKYIRVLVLLVGVARLVADGGREGKLGDAVEALLGRLDG